MKLLPLLLILCLDGCRDDLEPITNAGGIGSGITVTDTGDSLNYDNGALYVVDDTVKPSYQSIDYISTEFHNWGSRIQLITEMRGKKDTSVYIQGDTMQLIKSMFIFYLKTMAEKDSIIRELRNVKARTLNQ